jgi:tetratricopeptide (TPR) repeat protein
MKKYYLLIIILGLFFSLNTYAQKNSLELGKRYIKLGGSFRESGEFNLSKQYLEKGLSVVSRYNAKYWVAVGNEYLGYYWRDRAQIEGKDKYFSTALKHLDKALNIYQSVLKVDPSSIQAVKRAIATLRNKGEVNLITEEEEEEIDLDEGETLESEYMDEALEAMYQHQYDKAKRYLKKALKENPDSEMAKYLLYIMPKIEQYPSPGLNYEKIKIITSKKELKSDFVNRDEVDIIDLSNSEGMTRIPRELEDFPNVKILNLSNNDISRIKEDDGLCNLKELKILDLSYNELTEIPECIKFMPKLQVLYLRGNDILFAEILRLKDENMYLQIVMDEED